MKRKHPKGLPILFFTEMWERLSYYGMRAKLHLKYGAEARLMRVFSSTSTPRPRSKRLSPIGTPSHPTREPRSGSPTTRSRSPRSL